MIENPDLPQIVLTEDGPLIKPEDPRPRKPPVTKTRRLVGAGLLAFILILVGVASFPAVSTRLGLTSRDVKWQPSTRGPKSADRNSAHAKPVAAVQVVWERLNLRALPADVAQALESGKYYYDNRYPGNFGLAIGYWKQALARLSGADREVVQDLIASAETELARQFTTDSGDVMVLLKQRKKDQAILLLEKMRADFLDITAPQYIWTSVMLARQRR
ncbi:MAG: hypothetical protein ABIK62_05630 [candidate division WOR-3 bacterium]